MSDLEVLGIADVLAGIEQAINQLEQETDAEINKAGDEFRAEARRRAHVISGEMRDSVTHEHEHLESTITADVKQAVFEEFGTRHRPPHTWYFPSFELIQRRLQGRLKKL
jgi:hypothetical protein